MCMTAREQMFILFTYMHIYARVHSSYNVYLSRIQRLLYVSEAREFFALNEYVEYFLPRPVRDQHLCINNYGGDKLLLEIEKKKQ